MPQAIPPNLLADFQQQLVGNWSNQNFGNDSAGNPVGGPENPLSYCIMPLPQTSDPDGYILKNFTYYEQQNFNDSIVPAAEAANRGGLISQNARALFYEQVVRFGEGPAKGLIIHEENGAWLWLPRFVQQDGPYPGTYDPATGVYTPDIDINPITGALAQPIDTLIAKQVSVPHGNSILALGGFDTVANPNVTGGCQQSPMIAGSPVIPDGRPPYPTPATPVVNSAPPPSLISSLNADQRYSTPLPPPGTPNTSPLFLNFQNPHPDLTLCPNKPLQQAVAIIQPDSYMHFQVTTEPLEDGTGSVSNIPFEQRLANVTQFWADNWILFKGSNKYLAYTQTILMVLTIKGQKYVFPHLTCNTVTWMGPTTP